MGSRLKEDERNERIIRGLLKLPENRRCINCNSLGPQYVCTSFWTFVCTTCSGIHREFTHRVKSVSMAKFTSQEVAALQEGGNQKARDIYLKEWDSQHQSGPDGSNIERLRDFIKHVYVDRRFSGEHRSSKPSSGRMGEKDDSYDSKKSELYRGGSRSPPYEDSGERRYGDRSSPGARSENSRYGKRSPGHDQYNDTARSPSRPEIINDWRREDRFGNGSKADDGEAKLEGKSMDNTKDSSSPPAVRPVREILGESSISLVVELPKPAGAGAFNGSAKPQIARSASSAEGDMKKAVEAKVDTMQSLIDFDADSEPSAAHATHSSVNSATLDNSWASFESQPKQQVYEAPSNASSLESALSQISLSQSLPGTDFMSSFSTSSPAQASSVPMHGGNWPNLPQYQRPPYMPPLGAALSSQSMAYASNIQPSLVGSSMRQPSPDGSLPSGETKSTGRKELPQDLFTTPFAAYHAPMPYWQGALSYPMGYSMTAVPPHAAFHQPKSANPFDAGDTHSQTLAHPLHPTANFHGSMPNVSPLGMQHSAFVSPAWLPGQSSPFPSGAALPRPNLPPQPQTNYQYATHPHAAGAGVDGSGYGAAMEAQSAGRSGGMQPFPPQGGNPFG